MDKPKTIIIVTTGYLCGAISSFTRRVRLGSEISNWSRLKTMQRHRDINSTHLKKRKKDPFVSARSRNYVESSNRSLNREALEHWSNCLNRNSNFMHEQQKDCHDRELF